MHGLGKNTAQKYSLQFSKPNSRQYPFYSCEYKLKISLCDNNYDKQRNNWGVHSFLDQESPIILIKLS